MEANPPSFTGYSLFINCVPRFAKPTPTQSLEAYTGALADAVAKANGKVDIRCIPFGEGKGFLASAARKNPPVGILVGSRGELTSIVIEALSPGADLIVEGA